MEPSAYPLPPPAPGMASIAELRAIGLAAKQASEEFRKFARLAPMIGETLRQHEAARRAKTRVSLTFEDWILLTPVEELADHVVDGVLMMPEPPDDPNVPRRPPPTSIPSAGQPFRR